ncbi:MAG: hypothetical protein WBV69_15210 [Candidatus Sulfotelmatobacter sp.]
MLSQLFTALKDVQTESLHPWVNKVGKGPIYVVEISETGSPLSVRLRTSPEPLSCICKSAENVFPAIKAKPKPNRNYETVIVTAIGNCVRFAKQLSFFEPAIAMVNVEPEMWHEKFKEVWERAKQEGIFTDKDDYRKGYLLLSRGHIYTAVEYNDILRINADSSGSPGLCSLTGQQGELETHKFPSPVLPALGVTYLFARNEDIPCLSRYGRNGAASISVSKHTLGELSGKLALITQDGWEGKTWAKIQVNGHNALLLAYTNTRQRVELAELLASDDDLYTVVCEKVLAALKAHSKQGANASLVKILCLRTLDQGTKGIEFEKDIDSEALLSGFNRMLELVRQAPSFASFKKDERVLPLSPYRIANLLEHQYRMDGGKNKIHSEYFETCLELLIGDGQAAAATLLPVALQRATPLLLGKGNSDYSKIISMLYILRGGIMETTAFYIGRYLSVADWLHRVYCEQVRDRKMPSQLIGSSYLAQALTNPQRGFANMSLRLSPYLSWAKTRGARHAGGIVATLDKLATEILQSGGFGTKTTDQERADILLGFHFRKPAASADESSVCEQNSQAATAVAVISAD